MERRRMNVEKLLRAAEFEALKSDMKHKMSAIIFDGDSILGSGHNHYFCKGSIKKYKVYGIPVWSIHAEMDALRNTPQTLIRGSSILVYRLGIKMARPCRGCAEQAKSMGIRNIFYTEEDRVRRW
jgi:deoxycytidylate deaminase